MRGTAIVGAVLVILGLFFLYELRGPLVQFIVVVLEAVGIVLALVLIVVGFALIFWRPRRFWYRVEETET